MIRSVQLFISDQKHWFVHFVRLSVLKMIFKLRNPNGKGRRTNIQMTSGHRGVSWPVHDTLLFKSGVISVFTSNWTRLHENLCVQKKKKKKPHVSFFPPCEIDSKCLWVYSRQEQVTLSVSPLLLLQQNVVVGSLTSSQSYNVNQPMQQQKIKWWWSLRHHCSSSGLNVWVSDLKVLSPAEEERKKNITWKKAIVSYVSHFVSLIYVRSHGFMDL